MSSWVIALVVRPLAVAFFLVLILCLKWVVWRWMPEGDLKQALFREW
jgi:hypothetical protein